MKRVFYLFIIVVGVAHDCSKKVPRMNMSTYIYLESLPRCENSAVVHFGSECNGENGSTVVDLVNQAV